MMLVDVFLQVKTIILNFTNPEKHLTIYSVLVSDVELDYWKGNLLAN